MNAPSGVAASFTASAAYMQQQQQIRNTGVASSEQRPIVRGGGGGGGRQQRNRDTLSMSLMPNDRLLRGAAGGNGAGGLADLAESYAAPIDISGVASPWAQDTAQTALSSFSLSELDALYSCRQCLMPLKLDASLLDVDVAILEDNNFNGTFIAFLFFLFQ